MKLLQKIKGVKRVKPKKLTDKELDKWLEIIGPVRMEYLYIESKIYLTKEQLDRIIEYKKIFKEEKK